MLDILKELSKTKIVLVASHELAMMLPYADVYLTINDGNLVLDYKYN